MDIRRFLFFPLMFTGFFLYSQDLSIGSDDLKLELRADGGFHLFIRKKPNVASVLLTETTRDPALQADNYAYRAGEWNSVNGDEIRILNGVPIPKENRIYSLISSTVENHKELGEAFHIYIPHVLYYGYEEGRHGEVNVTDGTYLNIRTFALPYADYRGAFKDNPFTLAAKQEPPENPSDKYIKETFEKFTEIAAKNNGELIPVDDTDNIVDLIRGALEKEKGKTVDIVICLDTTNSMKKYIDPFRIKLIPMLNDLIKNFSSFRIGMVLYKDYHDAYLTRIIPFTNNFTRFQNDLNAIRVSGGGDIPEAVYEALFEGADKFQWTAEARVIILVGDAPPHPKPRGKITKEAAFNAASARNIKIYAMLLPQ